jgi:hypothetical protein
MHGPARLIAWASPFSVRCKSKRFGLGVLPHGPVQRGQVIQAGGRVGVLVANAISANLGRFLQEWLSLGIVAHGFVQFGQIIKALRRIRVLAAEDLSPDLEGFL